MSRNWLVGCMLLWAVSVSADDGLRDLEFLQAGYSQREGLIETMQATCESRGVNLDTGVVSEPSETVRWVADRTRIRYQRNPDLFGAKIPDNSRGPLDQIFVDGVSTSIRQYMHPDGKLDSQATITASGSGPSTFTDFRSRTLDYVLDNPPLTVTDALADRKNVLSCALQKDGQYLVEYKVSEHGTCQVWLSPMQGFLVTRMNRIYKKNPRFVGVDEQVVDAREVLPGLWMPFIVDMKHILRSETNERVEPRTAARFQVTSLVVNEPLADDAFEVKFPVGTEVSDEIAGRLFFQREDGPGPDMPLPEMQVPESIEDLPPERNSMKAVFVVANLAALVLVATWLVVVRKRG